MLMGMRYGRYVGAVERKRDSYRVLIFSLKISRREIA
jgi:hypothetical protein